MNGRVRTLAVLLLGVTCPQVALPRERTLPRRVLAGQGYTDRIPGVEFSYEQVRNPRSHLLQRVIVSRPAGTTGRLPAVFFIPWLSCDSVEVPPGARGGIETLLYRLAAEPGLVLFRVEKPGVGDSEGDCAQTDFETEMAGNVAAFAAARGHPWIDPGRVVAMGQSFAGGLLPLVAPPSQVSGYLFLNSYVRTWIERILGFERLRLEGAGLEAGTVSERMRLLVRLYVAILESGETPAEAIRRDPALALVWKDQPEHQYGRPVRFFQQLERANVAAAWARVDCPTLAIWGEADPVMAREEHERVVALVNRNRPGAARLVTVPGMDHGLSSALPGGKTGLPEPVADVILSWLKGVALASAGPGGNAGKPGP